jgi:hypothetical protein
VGADGGRDVAAWRRDGLTQQRVYIQCKRLRAAPTASANPAASSSPTR